jgi:hypothetical protein
LTTCQEEKDRVIDLSHEDPDSIGAFVYYLYNLNYDAALFRENGDHLSLHVQMCVLGDKYDMRPLQDLAIEKFRTLTTDNPPTGNDLANAAVCAYEAVGATTEIRKVIVKLAIDNKLIPTEICAEPATDLERAIQTYPGLCLDIMKVQQSMLKPKSFRCPFGCGHVCSHPINSQVFGNSFYCTRCRRTCSGWQWWQLPVNDD